MGIDIATYRSRIGCCSNNSGRDIITVAVDVHFSKAAKYTGYLFSITMLLAMTVFNLNFSHLHEKLLTEGITSVEGTIFTAGTVSYFVCRIKRSMLVLKTVGAVTFIQLLLLSAGVEPNPGPLPGLKEQSEKGIQKTETEQNSNLEPSLAEAIALPQEVTGICLPDETLADSDEDEEASLLENELRRLEEERRLKEEQIAKQKELRKKELKDRLLKAKMDIRRLDVKLRETSTTVSTASRDPNDSQTTTIDNASHDATKVRIHNVYDTVETDVKHGQKAATVSTASRSSTINPNISQTAEIDNALHDVTSAISQNIDDASAAKTVQTDIPRVTIEQNSYSVSVGQSVTLQCSVKAVPPCTSVAWKRTVEEITTDINVDGSFYRGSSAEFPSLTIDRVRNSDEGTYVCFASNKFGTGRSVEVTLEVSGGDIPRVTVEQNSYSVSVGQSVTLQCSVKAVPPCTSVAWKRTVEEITTDINVDGSFYRGSSAEFPSLTIDRVRNSDEGTYVCFASNKFGTGRSVEVTLEVSGGDIPRVTIEQNSYSVSVGQSVTLQCSVKAVPPCTSVAWKRTVEGVTTDINVDGSFYRGTSAEFPSLTIDRVSNSDEGTYVCFASNKLGTGCSVEVTLEVSGGDIPRVTIEQNSYSVSVGQSVTLQCSVEAVPPCTSVAWKRTVEGVTTHINVDGSFYRGSNAEFPSLTIDRVRNSDEGTYVCFASNKFGTGRSVDVTLEVSGGDIPVVSVKQTSYSVLFGESVTLQCSVNAVPACTTVTWQHIVNGIATLVDLDGFNYTGSRVNCPSLTISSPGHLNEGIYICNASNDVGTGRSVDVTLKVTGSVPDVGASPSYAAIRGETVTLQCTVNADPKADSVEWEKTVDNTITSIKIDGNKYQCGTVDSPSLVINSVESYDEGSYTCTATNIVGTGRSKPICLIVDEDSAENPISVWESIMKKLGISTTTKLSFNDVMAITLRQEKDLQTSDIPRELLSGLIMIDYKVRDNLPELVFKGCSSSINNEETEYDYDTEGTFDINNDTEGTFDIINTQDMFITLFDSCDSFLKQIIVNKMFICRLAIPIIYHSMPNRIPCFSLWPLRSTIFEIKGDKVTEVSIVQIPMKIVSFVRYDRLDSMSKSKLLNDILSDESHDTFYHRDCPLGLTDRKLADGLVEASWYIPAGKETDFFENVTMFFNLRGDAGRCKEQLDFLNKVSNVIVIIIDTEKAYELFSGLNKTQLQTTKVLLLLTGKSVGNRSKNQELTRLCKSKIPNVTIISTFRKNASDLKKELRKRIQSLYNTNEKTLETCAEIATKMGLFSDEDTPDCKNSKREAEAVYKHLNLTDDVSLVKEKLLPLQGDLWKKWTDEYKKLKKPGKSSVNENDKHNQVLATLRSEQEKVAESITPFLKAIIEVLTKHSSNRDYISYFLNWIKFYLDGRSREIISPLTLKYHECWKKFKDSHDKNRETDTSLKDELESAEKALVDASLGFEHIIRELGQLYEVTVDCALSDKSNLPYIRGLPNIISRLLLFGFPIELMDGDAANVPCRWIEAVFDSLIATTGNKRVLTLSILGVQSSGKSTFLNTMFGLQFAVSAGRCTRGIYMQLLPVNHNKSKMFKFDYILVLDTEGIRAPELGLQKHDHDNELATLILGLGDVTIINIKGENTSEIKDVLQIAVHAFLRLKSANKKLDLQQSCTFVHQNVPAMNAQQKMQQGRQKLVQNLDNMTAVAAEQEHIRNIKTFNQVIQFDSQENVWYLSDLWHGDPPMSHANPGYSGLVKKVKDSILLSVNQQRKTFLTLTDTSRCIVDLWNGILADDYVFSFRNSIEMKLYSSMETAYQKMTWELERFMDELLRQKSLVISVNDSPDAICSSFEGEVKKKAALTTQTLETYFDTHEYSEILIQWKAAKVQLFKFFTREIIEKSKIDLRKRHEEKRIGNETEVKNNHRIQQITEKAKCLAMELKGEKPSEDEMRRDFEYMWSEWIQNISATLPEYEIDLCVEVTNALFDGYPDLHTLLQNQLEKRPLRHWDEKEELSDYIKHYHCKSNVHVSFRHTTSKVVHLFSDQIKVEVQNFATELSKQVHTLFGSIDKMDTKFENVHLRKIFQKVDKKFNSHNNDEAKQFSFLSKFQAIVLVHVCRFTVYKFKAINERYQKKHCPRAKIATFKETTWNMFKNIVSAKSEEIIAANLFCDTVRSFVERTMNDKIYINVKDKILVGFQHSKYSLIIRIMDELADKDDFQLFIDYVSDPKNYAVDWMMTYTKAFLVDTPDENEKTVYEKMAEVYVSSIMEEIQKQLPKASKICEDVKSNNMETFITYITNNCVEFTVEEADRKRLCDFAFHSIKDFIDVTEMYLKDTKEKILGPLRKVKEIVFSNPIHEEIIDRLWGCEAVCPFCYEPCQSMKNHNGSHTAVQHRPTGIRGLRNSATKILCKESCSFNVQSPKSFFCSVVGNQCQYPNCKKGDEVVHEYTEYKDVIPHWDITKCSDQSNSKYWNWFMVKHMDDLLQHHQTKRPEIPAEWKGISKTQAKNSLRNVYLVEKS